MVFFNYSTMQMAAKVVYYGPGLCGKTTNLHYIYGHTTNDSRGEMVSLETETDRTLFFDLLPLDVGSIAGFNTRIQLYTVPGQVFYNTTRKLVLKGVDGVVFVADSQRAMLQANIDAFRNLEENLAEMGLSVDSLPLVLQYNKRDLADIYSVEELNQALNRQGWPHYEASAVSGHGVFETLKGISKHTLLALKRRLGRSSAEAGAGRGAAGGAAGSAARPVAAPPPAAATGTTPPSAPGTPSVPTGSHATSSPGAAGAAPTAAAAARTASPQAAAPAQPAAAAGSHPAPPVPASYQAGPAAPAPVPATTAASGSHPATAAAAPPASGSTPARQRTPTGKSRAVDVLGELEKLRREALQSTGAHALAPSRSGAIAGAARALPNTGSGPAPLPPRPVLSTAGTGTGGNAAAAGPGASGSHPRVAPPAAAYAANPAATPGAAAGNGRAELSRSIDLTLKRADFARARRFLLSFQVEDDQHRVVDAVRDLQVEIKDAGDSNVEKLLLRLNIALHAKE